jgi:methyl-accepting chemotaxis protein
MEEQGVATQEIARSVSQAATGTQQASGGMHAVKGAAENAGEAATRVLEAARDVAGHSSELQSELQTFLVDMKAA